MPEQSITDQSATAVSNHLKKKKKKSWLVSWCFKPSQTLRIIPGLRDTFVKRYIVERTSKAEIRPEEQSEKAESCWENFTE